MLKTIPDHTNSFKVVYFALGAAVTRNRSIATSRFKYDTNIGDIMRTNAILITIDSTDPKFVGLELQKCII